MHKLDEEILRAYFRLEEYQTHRIRMERMFHPEKFEWKKEPPPISEAKRRKLEEMERIGFGEAFYQQVLQNEQQTKRELEELVEVHPLWMHIKPIPGFGKYLAGAFIAAGGDITKPDTCSKFWKGMGLDVLPDGSAPRRVRGKKNVERKIPALPHVTKVGEQVRQQMLKLNYFYQSLYERHKEDYQTRYPESRKMFAHKHGLRVAQKVLYSTLWERWRQAYGLPAPFPYVFDILKHSSGHRITLEDFQQKRPSRR